MSKAPDWSIPAVITASKIAHATLLHRLGSSLLGKFFAQMLEITYAEESIVVAENITDKDDEDEQGKITKWQTLYHQRVDI